MAFGVLSIVHIINYTVNLSRCIKAACPPFIFPLPRPQLAEGVGQLLFEVCKGVPTQFHTCTAKVSRSMLMMTSLCQHLPLLYPPLLPPQVLPLVLLLMGDPHLPGQEIFTSLTIMVELMAEHTRRDHASLLWDCLLVCWGLVCAHVKVCVCVCVFVCTGTSYFMTYFPSSLQAHTHHLHTQWQSSGSSEVATLLRWMLHLLGVLMSCRNGSRISKVDQVIQVMWGVGGVSWVSYGILVSHITCTLQLGPMVPVAV